MATNVHISYEELKKLSQLIKIRRLAILAGIDSGILVSKLHRKKEFTYDESEALKKVIMNFAAELQKILSTPAGAFDADQKEV